MNILHRIAPYRFALTLSVLVASLPASVGQAGAALAQAPSDSAFLPEGIEATGDTAEVRALHVWANEHRKAYPEQAKQITQRALALAQHLNDQRGIAKNFMLLGNLASDPHEAEVHYTVAQEAFGWIGDERGLFLTWLNIGNTYRERGDLEQALTYYFDALEGLERLGDTEGLAVVLNNIGDAVKSQGNREEALAYFERAAALTEAAEEPSHLSYILNNFGTTLAEQGSFKEAEMILQRALVLSKEGGTSFYTACITNNLGYMYNLQGRYGKALPHLFDAERLSKEFEYPGVLFAVTDELGKAYLGLGQTDRALHYARQSLVLARETASVARQMLAHQTLSQIYEAAGNDAQALAHYRQYAAAKDSVFTAEKAAIITEMQTRYETEEKQRAIEHLEQENQIQLLQASRRQTLLFAGVGGLLLLLGFLFSRYRLKQRANRLLSEQKEAILQEKEEKEILLQEIHHRVKNNLQVIAGLLGMQAKEAHDENALATLREAQGRVQAITLLHQKLYREEGLTQVNMQEYLDDLSAYLVRTFDVEDLSCRVQARGIRLDVDTAVPLGLITNELVSNAFEHAFPEKEGGEVHVRLQEEKESGYELEVSDNGMGFTSERLDDNGSVGMKLVESLTHQLRGRLHIENGQGVTFRIHFEQANVVS